MTTFIFQEIEQSYWGDQRRAFDNNKVRYHWKTVFQTDDYTEIDDYIKGVDPDSAAPDHYRVLVVINQSKLSPEIEKYFAD